MNDQSLLQPQMTEAAIHLGQKLIASDPYVRFQKAERALKSDTAALSLLNDLSMAQERIRKAQSSGTITPEDLQAISNLQTQAQADPVITEYKSRQQELTTFLQGINAEISQLLGINFALIARRSSCC